MIKGKSDLKMNLLVDFCHLSKSNWLAGTLYWRHIITKVWEVSFLLYELSSIWSRSALLVRFFFLQKIAGYWPWFGFSVYKLKSKTTQYYMEEKIGCFLKLVSIVVLICTWNELYKIETIMNSFTFPIEKHHFTAHFYTLLPSKIFWMSVHNLVMIHHFTLFLFLKN